jgi:hypothetical protein
MLRLIAGMRQSAIKSGHFQSRHINMAPIYSRTCETHVSDNTVCAHVNAILPRNFIINYYDIVLELKIVNRP